MTDQGNDSCNIVIKEETEIFDYHIQDPEQDREYVLDNINDIKPELIQLSLADLDAQFKTWENFFREQNGLPEFYMGLNVNNALVPHKIVPIGNGSSDFFYTLSFLIFHDFNHASFVRINVAQHVADNWELFKEYAVDPSSQRLYYSAKHYLNEMLKPDTPGRGCELLAAARLFATKFELYIDETLCFHCGMTATNVVRRIKVSPLEGSVHFDAYEPISDEEVKNFGGPRKLNAENSDDERMRKEFMKSVEKHLLKIIFPDFMIKTAEGDVEHKQVIKSEPKEYHHGFEAVFLTETPDMHFEEEETEVKKKVRRGKRIGRPKKIRRPGRPRMCVKYGNIHIEKRSERAKWNKKWKAENLSKQAKSSAD